jgi:hypothetical protein
MVKYRTNKNSTITLINDQRENAWDKLNLYSENLKELKERLYNDRDKDKIFLSSVDNLLVLSSLSIIIGELAWRSTNEEGPVS